MSRPSPFVRCRLFILALCANAALLSAGCWWAPLCPSPGDWAEMRKGPYLLYPGDNTSMTVLWQADATPTRSSIRWGSTADCADGFALVTESASGPEDHQLSYTIDSLAPGGRTYYTVTLNEATYTGSFLTAPEADATSVSFYAYGDTRSQPNDHDWVVAQLLTDRDAAPDARQTFCLHAGDFVMTGQDEWSWDDEYFERNYPHTQTFLADLPVIGCLGNHEIYHADYSTPAPADLGNLFRKYWPFPFMPETPPYYYSFDYGPVHVAVLDQYTTSYAAGSPQLVWLEQDLAASEKPWKIVMFHDPLWTAYDQGSGPYSRVEQRAALCPIFEANGVSVVIQGHDHFYARCVVNGIHYLTLGAGGAPRDEAFEADAPHVVVAVAENHFARIDVTDAALTVTVISDGGEQLDAVTIDAGQ
jgi:hypothetical protein